METEETFADAHECFSDETYPSETCLNSNVAHTNEFREVGIRQESSSASMVDEALEKQHSCRSMQVSSERSTYEGYLMKQTTGEHRDPNYINSIRYEDLADCGCRTTEKTRNLDYVMVNAPLNVICRASISFKDPIKFRTKMEFLFGSSVTQKLGMKVPNELDKLAIQNIRVADLESNYNLHKGVTISPIGPLAVNAVNGSGNISSILRSPLLIQLADQVKSIVSDRSKYIEIRETRCSGSDSSPGGHCGTSSLAQDVESVGNLRYDSDFTRQELSDDVILLCSSSRTADSCKSSLPSRLNVSTGVLQCVWEGGTPHFIFSLDDQGKIYVAKPQKIESSEDKSLDWVYLFSIKSGGCAKKTDGVGCVSDVGRMKVSSSLSIDWDNPNQFRSVETEYVLFGVSEELERGRAHASSVVKKAKEVQKIVPGIVRASHSPSHSIDVKAARHVSSSKDPFCVYVPDAQKNSGKLRVDNPFMDLLVPNLQLVAMVVKSCMDHKSTKESAIGGWGLKFLKKREVADSNLSCNGNDFVLKKKGTSVVDMAVLVPEDIHGGPLTKDGGPSSLIERWRSGGQCDCGGWDIGCPLKVLDNRCSKDTSVAQDESVEECKSFSLFIQGNKEDSPTLKMVNIHEGLYFVHFQSTLSALQSFSIGVAIIHSQSPSLFSKMYST